MGRKKQLTFEEALEKLENVVELMENGDIPLEEAIGHYKEGMELSLFCSTKLEEIEKEVMLLQKNSDGNFQLKPFTIEEDTD